MPMVECENLSKMYLQGDTRVKALDGVSLGVETGEFMALVGPSGSGKTTLLNLIGGLDEASSGEVRVDGDEITRMSQSELSEMRLRKIGFVFQAYNLIPVLSALENVEFVLMLQGVEKAVRLRIAKEMLERVGLKEQMNRRPGEMSGGQQQRVAVARAIAPKPAVVLADEPTANLDSQTGEHLMDIMADLNKKLGITFVFSTHDAMVMERALRVVRLRDGHIEEDSSRSS